MPKKRESISKKMRFEVFKRDSFTCQYCGRKAPDVVLHVDHITPVSKGGKNALMNLVTSCFDCNMGKGARVLDENSTVEKERRQAELLQARREQLTMIRDWHNALADQEDLEIDIADEHFQRLTGGKYCMTDSYRTKLRTTIRKFGLSEVLESLKEGIDVYKDPTKALSKVPGICACRQNPFLRKRAYILAIMQNNVYYGNFNKWKMVELLDRGYEAGGEDFVKTVEEWSKKFSGTWKDLLQIMEKAVSEWEASKDGRVSNSQDEPME